jgi:transcriptional regulator of arginine metabolism
MAVQPNVKQRRQRTLLELVSHSPIGSQEELVELLHARGFVVTQATVSRDAAELGLVKVLRADGHVYATPESAATGNAYDARLSRLLEDIPVRVGRSGLSLVLLATPGWAGAIAQAIDQSSLTDQVGTLAGDNTLLVLFETEAALERWLVRFQTFQPSDESALPNGRPSPADGPVAQSEAPR